MAFSPTGGTLAVGATDCKPCSLSIIDAKTGGAIRTFAASKRSIVHLSFVDEQRVAVGAEDGSISVWDITRAEQVAEDHRHRDRILSLVRAGDLLISASADTSIRLLPLPKP